MECYISKWLLQRLFSYAIKKNELEIFGPIQGRTWNIGFILQGFMLSSDLFKVLPAILTPFLLKPSCFLRTYSRSYWRMRLLSFSSLQSNFWPPQGRTSDWDFFLWFSVTLLRISRPIEDHERWFQEHRYDFTNPLVSQIRSRDCLWDFYWLLHQELGKPLKRCFDAF